MSARTPPKGVIEGFETTRVADAMHRGVVTCSRTTSLVTVARLMAANDVHCVVVVAQRLDGSTKVCGVVSDRDVLVTAVRGELSEAKASGSARTEPLTVLADDRLLDAAELMAEHGATHVVVVDGSLEPIGILSTLDVAAVVGRAWPPPRRSGATRVEELMTSPVVTVPPDLPLKEVARVFVENGISGAPVVEGERLLGVITEADIVARERGPGDRHGSVGTLVHAKARRDTGEATAFEAMTTPAITVGRTRSGAAAATLMTEHRVKRLPVIEDGRLVGIVTRSDLVRAFARSDEEIERDIRENILVRDLWLRPDDVGVVVDHGRVTLTGVVDSKVAARLLTDEVEAVPGVTSVHSDVGVSR